jgi:myotubularin-related protein 6/7/8
MDTATFIAKALYHEGVSVLVHCSDGWDRTAQTCALASLLIDPYYRTIHGFMILIEKEWLSFGHKFTTRCGHLNGDSKEVSPIFTQFLDAVWQVLVQFPVHFQFNELFLITIHDHLYSCQFGTFFGNNEKERKDNKFSSKTYSLWGYIWTHLDDFVNSLYDKDIDNQLIVPVFDIPFLRFWKGLYCRYDTGPHAQELWEEVACSYFQQNICLEDHIRYLTQHMNDLKEKLHHYKSHCTQKCNNEDTDQISDETKQIAESNERYGTFIYKSMF